MWTPDSIPPHRDVRARKNEKTGADRRRRLHRGNGHQTTGRNLVRDGQPRTERPRRAGCLERRDPAKPKGEEELIQRPSARGWQCTARGIPEAAAGSAFAQCSVEGVSATSSPTNASSAVIHRDVKRPHVWPSARSSRRSHSLGCGGTPQETVHAAMQSRYGRSH